MATHHDSGGALLADIANEVVRLQKKFFGKGPESAKAYFLDDMLFVVMRDGLTTAEQTMLAFGHRDQVRAFRQLFENEMTGRMTGKVEELTGRKVLTYQSQILFDPATVVEIFVFDDTLSDSKRAATAEGQLHDDETGEATADDVLDPPSPSGH